MSGQRWAEFVGKTALVVALGSMGVFVAVRAAVAREGVTGAARTWVTVAGTVTGLPGDPRAVAMRFAFHRPGEPMPLCAPAVSDVRVEPGGAFSVQVPLDDAAARCPPETLDGRNVEVDVDVGAIRVVTNAAVNPVPYAHFATNAGTAMNATTAGGVSPGSALEQRIMDQSGAAMAVSMCGRTDTNATVDAVNIPAGATGHAACSRAIREGTTCGEAYAVFPSALGPYARMETNRFACDAPVPAGDPPNKFWACCVR